MPHRVLQSQHHHSNTKTTSASSSSTLVASPNLGVMKVRCTTTATGVPTTTALTASLAKTETRVVHCLRLAVVVSLAIAAAVVSVGVYQYTKNAQAVEFQSQVADHAHQILVKFHDAVERSLGAAASLSTALTSHALQQQQQQQQQPQQQANVTTTTGFPFVTLPDFILRGSDVRAQSGSHLLYWCPLVTQEQRPAWEDYARQHRQHATWAVQEEASHRQRQDESFRNRQLQTEENVPELTVLEDGYHPRLWSNGAITPRGDEPEEGGPFLALWQQSPATPTLPGMLNLNVANVQVLSRGLIDIMATEKKAVLNHATRPIQLYKQYMNNVLHNSQYRNHVQDKVDGLHTMVTYPVFDSFDYEQRQMAGILAMDLYWEVLLANLLPENMQGIVCVITNSYNQTFSYRLDGPNATELAMEDVHDPRYDSFGISTNINAYMNQRASPQTSAYATVELSDSVQFSIRIYPSADTQARFVNNDPVLYTVVVLLVFAFAAMVFLCYSYVVERRQRVMTQRVMTNAQKVAETERELNEFLSHEIRNPLSAAISASTFLTTVLQEPEPLRDDETRSYARQDVEVVNSSLHFINDFLRSMLDIYRAAGNQIKVDMAPTDIRHDIFEPVSNILYQRLSAFEVQIDCPHDLVIMTDSIRLKQILLNLVRNSSKFVERGFIRMRARVTDDGQVRIYVEDSGPGISAQKSSELFCKYQESLDLLSQGTGIGLNLSKTLAQILGGNLWLDNDYDSGIEGCPGACFVVQLNQSPMDLETAFPSSGERSSELRLSVGRSGLTAGPPPVDKIQEEAQTSGDTSDPTTTDNGRDGVDQTSRVEMWPELPEELSVLFVDDDAMLRKLFMRAVRKVAPESWTINEASSGETALRLCETEQFHIIFLDQYMASASKQLLGTETALAMRSRGIDSKLVGLSANDLRDAFINAGADDFILKPMPCSQTELKTTLQKILYEERFNSSQSRQFLLLSANAAAEVDVDVL